MGNVKKENLWNEFPPVSTQQWEDLIRADLKGADYDKKLVWKTNEGFNVKPYYRAEDLDNLSYLKGIPNEYPFVRGNKSEGNYWEVRQDIVVRSIDQANHDAIEALGRGASSICFTSLDSVKTASDFSKLLKDIHFGCINFNLRSCRNAPFFFNLLIDETKKRAYDINKMDGSVGFNPLGVLTNSGNWVKSEADDFNSAKEIVEHAISVLPRYRVLNVNGSSFQESGSSIVQEVAFSIAIANEYLSKLIELGLNVDEIARRIQFNFSTSSNYFLEIAKIRAFRLLWSTIVKAYNPKLKDSSKAFVHCTTSKWNMTMYDPYVNMLRATTESMSAAIGGADSISINPFDEVYKKADSFSNRMARNTQLVLKEESYFDRIADPSAGSYYIENLTDNIAGHAWKLFQKVEATGGYSVAFLEGLIQDEIEVVANKRFNDIATRRDTLLGINQYPNFNEQILKNIDPEIFEASQKISDKPAARPLKKFRGSEAFENLRLKTEKSGRRPKVFMLTIGSLAMRLARSQFSSNFFGIAGFEVIDNNGFKTIEEGVKAAIVAKADIVVLCSSDDEYNIFAPDAFEKLLGKAIFVVAGTPSTMDELKTKGIQNFINMKSNILETLSMYQALLGI